MKLQKIGDIQPTLPFTEYDFLQKHRESFAQSELGRIRAQFPQKEMAAEFAYHFPKEHPQGNTPMELGERLPRSKYNDVDKARLAYAKQRKPKKSATRKLQRRLLSLLAKIIGQWNALCRQYYTTMGLTAEQEKRIMALREEKEKAKKKRA